MIHPFTFTINLTPLETQATEEVLYFVINGGGENKRFGDGDNDGDNSDGDI